LDNLVLKGRNRERALPAVQLRDVDPSGRQCPIRSPFKPCVQTRESTLEVRLVRSPRQPVDARRGILLEFEVCLPEMFDADVMEERGELFLLPLPCDLTYALQRLLQFPVLRPARALLVRIPLGLAIDNDATLGNVQSRRPRFDEPIHNLPHRRATASIR